MLKAKVFHPSRPNFRQASCPDPRGQDRVERKPDHWQSQQGVARLTHRPHSLLCWSHQTSLEVEPYASYIIGWIVEHRNTPLVCWFLRVLLLSSLFRHWLLFLCVFKTLQSTNCPSWEYLGQLAEISTFEIRGTEETLNYFQTQLFSPVYYGVFKLFSLLMEEPERLRDFKGRNHWHSVYKTRCAVLCMRRGVSIPMGWTRPIV